MSSVLTQFLIGIGWQTDDFNKGEREINRGLENVKTKVTVTGAAMVGAFIGVGNQVADVAHKVNSMSLNTNTLNASTRFVNNYGLALRGLGGDAGDAVGEIKGAESALMDLRLKGEAGPFGGALQLAGVSVDPLMVAESGAEFMQEIAKQMPSLTKEQRLSVQQILNLSPAGVELLAKGEAEYKKILNHVNAVAGLTPELISNSKELNAALAETELRWEGIKNTIALGIMPRMTEMIKASNEWVTDTIKPLAEKSPVSTAVGGTMIGAGVGAGAAAPLLGAVGATGVGAAAGAAAAPLVILGAGAVAFNMDQKDVKNTTGLDLPEWMFKPIGELIDDSGMKPVANPYGRGIYNPTIESFSAPDAEKAYEGGIYNPTIGSFSAPDVEKAYEGGIYNPTIGSFSAPDAEKAYEGSGYEDIKSAFSKIFSTESLAPTQKVEVQLKSSNLPPIQNNITVELDGRTFEHKVMEINDRQAQGAQDDLMSTTAR